MRLINVSKLGMVSLMVIVTIVRSGGTNQINVNCFTEHMYLWTSLRLMRMVMHIMQ